MATLKQAGELITEQLRERVDRLVSAVEDDAPDFEQIVRLADAVGELADTIGATYGDLERTLMGALPGDSGSQPGDDSHQEQEEVRGKQRQQQSGNGSTVEDATNAEDVTKDELLERAREVNVHGRSSMSKEELAQAVEAEESLTKEDLHERARQADIEGRSSMTKEELRKALREADV
jgi:hypothetical protein